MIIYNITFNINHDIERDWLEYMKRSLIPEIQATELILECKLLKLLTEIENEGTTYTTQLAFRTTEDFLTYQAGHQQEILDRHHQRYNGKYVYFRTLLQEM